MSKKPRILLVDDEPVIVKLLARRLEAAGFEVETAVDGMQAMEKLSGELPDLVILDVMMPKLNGYEVCRSIKEGALRQLPVIMLSARSQDKDEKMGLSCGADIYMKKPFKSEELVERMKELIHVENPAGG
jgi:DNA-binding response OmpR family regulator